MSTEKRRNKFRSSLIAALTLAGCSSAPVKTEVPPLCSGKMPSQKFVWTISFSQRAPKGTEISRVSELVKTRSELQENVSQSFVPGLIFLSSNGGKYSSHSRSQVNAALNQFARYLAEERSASLTETGSSNFISCIWDECEGLKDPVTGAIIRKEKDKRRSSVSSTPPRPIYYVEGIIDPSESKFDWHRQSSFSAPSPAYVDWKDYLERRPFPAGQFLSKNYFVVPEAKRGDLCQQAGFEKDCFAAPKYDFHNDLVTPLSCNIRDGKCRVEFATLAPHRYEFLMNHNGMCGTTCLDNTNAMLKKMKDDPHFRLQWESAIAKDIFLKLSVSTTRKVEKDWNVTRIEWNPTPFCQYAHPNADLLSQ